MNVADIVTSEMNEAIGRYVAVAVDLLYEEIEMVRECEIDHALDLAIETSTGAALTAAAIEVETAVMRTALAADLSLVVAHAHDRAPVREFETDRAHAQSRLLPDSDRALDLLCGGDHGPGAVPVRDDHRGKDAGLLVTLIATFLPTATAALPPGGESDLQSVMLDLPGLVILTVTSPALSLESPKRESPKLRQNLRKNRKIVGLDDAAAVAADDAGVLVEGAALAGVEVEVAVGAAAGENVEGFSKLEYFACLTVIIAMYH